MKERTLVPIFVFWAFLTIITPTLILLSENSKSDPDSNGNIAEGMKVSRMMGNTQNCITRTAQAPAKSEEELASAAAPAPEPLLTSTRITPTVVSHSHHNHTLESNRTHDGMTLSSPKVHVHVKQTNIR